MKITVEVKDLTPTPIPYCDWAVVTESDHPLLSAGSQFDFGQLHAVLVAGYEVVVNPFRSSAA